MWLPSSQRMSQVVRCFDVFVAVTTARCQVREKEAWRARTSSPTTGCEVKGKPGSGGRFSPWRFRGGWYGIGKGGPLLADQVRLCDRRLGPCGFRVRGVSVGVAGALGGLGGPRRARFRRSFLPLAGGRGGWYGIGRRRPSWVGQVGLCARSLRTRGFWGRRAGEGVARALGGAVGRFWKIRPGWKVRLRHKN